MLVSRDDALIVALMLLRDIYIETGRLPGVTQGRENMRLIADLLHSQRAPLPAEIRTFLQSYLQDT